MTRAEPVEHRFNAPAGEICWFEWGKPGHGPSVLLLHATGFHARCWDQVVAALPQNMHVIAPDLRGHGRSFRPDALFNWGLIADDIAALIDAIGHGPFFVVGHSMGGFDLKRNIFRRGHQAFYCRREIFGLLDLKGCVG